MTRTKIAALLVLAGIAVTGGSAFTDSVSGVPATTYIGSTSTTVDGGTASSITYTYDADYTHVTAIGAIFTGDVRTHTLHVIPTGGLGSGVVDCTAAGALNGGGNTVYTCDTTPTPADWTTSGLIDVRFVLTN